jgi:hypothetical protein
VLHDPTQDLGLILRGDGWKIGLAGAWPRRTAAAAEKVDAENAIAIAVQRAAGPDDVTPPALAR